MSSRIARGASRHREIAVDHFRLEPSHLAFRYIFLAAIFFLCRLRSTFRALELIHGIRECPAMKEKSFIDKFVVGFIAPDLNS